ncbi:MAG: aminotransferase class V-fold PLP-dependent enzyme [Proteobacteria bacterium]|nr:MAG: aminotransferase class V-fold PLP-dependent enzyme [Pseudomonadota bacterium]
MDFSSFFVKDESFAYLNAGTLSRTPLRVLAAMESRRQLEEINPTRANFASVELLWRVQESLGAFLGAEAEDLFLRANIMAAINDFLFALPLEGSGEILTTGLEYGAVANACRIRAAQAGMEYRQVKLAFGANTSGSDLARAILAELKPQTRVLVLSHVATGTGAILPIEEIGHAAQSRGIVVIVDGAHGVGSLPLFLKSLPVDFYGGNLHKWFMGPKGTAFGWVHPSWRENLEWRFGGWASFTKPKHFHGFGGSDEAARRVLPGTIDDTPFFGVLETLKFWEDHGAGELRTRQRDLRDLAAAEAEELGWERVSPRAPKDLGALVAFRRPAAWEGQDGVTLATRILKEARVQLALPSVQGENLVRFSPGIFATEDEVREGVRRLRGFQ